jgi:hypothetical protein
MPRVGERVREAAVVCQQKQTFTVSIQAANRVQAFHGRMPAPILRLQRGQDQLHHRVGRVGVRPGRIIPRRLVQRQIEGWRPGVDWPPIHLYGRLIGINLRPKRGDGPAVDLDAAGQNQDFGVAPGGDAGGGEYLLQALEHTWVPNPRTASRRAAV